MSRRHSLERHWQKLSEAREIISAMKSLAFMETRRLGRFLAVQRQVVSTIESAAADFLNFYPKSMLQQQVKNRVFLLLGSERGFCGSFNDSLVREVEKRIREEVDITTGIIACGQKISSKLEGHPQLLTSLEGASVLDEVDITLNRLVKVLMEQQSKEMSLALSVLYHDPEKDQIIVRELLPPFSSLRTKITEFTCAPQLNLRTEEFLMELVDHYLFAVLHEILYVSLMAENQQRMQHLEGAVRYLDDSLEVLRRRGNQLRQEEIIEEIEVISLSADSSTLPPTGYLAAKR